MKRDFTQKSIIKRISKYVTQHYSDCEPNRKKVFYNCFKGECWGWKFWLKATINRDFRSMWVELNRIIKVV